MKENIFKMNQKMVFSRYDMMRWVAKFVHECVILTSVKRPEAGRDI